MPAVDVVTAPRYGFELLRERVAALQPAPKPAPTPAPAKPDPFTGPAPVAPRNGAHSGPLDAFNASATWAAILEPAGWRHSYRGDDGLDYWTRPGKDAGTSATTGVRPTGGDTMKCFSDNAGLPTEGTLTRAFVWAALSQGTSDPDMERAAAEMRSIGYGDAPARIDPSDLIAPPQPAAPPGPPPHHLFTRWFEGHWYDGDGNRYDAPAASTAAPVPARRVDLGPWLDGTYRAPEPAVGAVRDDGRHLLYPGRWHTLIGPTEAGKTWAALAHVRDEILAGRVATYLHFEESDPGGTVARLLALGVPVEVIRERFVWLSCDYAWKPGALAVELAALAARPALVVLDGINAACSRHGHDVEKTPAVGWYRGQFVAPATQLGAAVLSLGHPPKARDRQDERHGYGSTAWLDDVDGVGFRLVPGRAPIRRGDSGTAGLHVVKDRYGAVAQHGVRDDREGWTYVGSVVVDDTLGALVVDETPGRALTSMRISTPERNDGGGRPAPDSIDHLATAVVGLLRGQDEHAYPSARRLGELLRAAKIKFREGDLAPALDRLESDGRLERPPHVERKPRPGRLTASAILSEDDQDDNRSAAASLLPTLRVWEAGSSDSSLLPEAGGKQREAAEADAAAVVGA